MKMSEINATPKQAIDAVGVPFNGDVQAILPYLVEVKLKESDAGSMANRVRETLERIGTFAGDTPDVLNQVAHLITVDGKQYISHFKFLYLIYQGTDNRLKDSDIARQNKIIDMLSNWGFIEVVNPEQLEGVSEETPAGVKVVRWQDKGKWKLTPKFRRQRITKPAKDTDDQ